MVIDILKIEDEVESQVFETTDVVIPQFRPFKVIEDKDLPEIDRKGINGLRNLAFFKSKVGDTKSKAQQKTKNKPPLFKKTLKSDNYQLDTEDSEGEKESVHESASQRLKRIILEVQELEQEIDINEEKTEKKEENDVDLVNMLNEMNDIQRLLKLKMKTEPDQVLTNVGFELLIQLNKAYFKEESKFCSPPSYEQQINHALELEARVTSLEALLGAETLVKAEIPNEQSLTKMIDDMQHMLKRIRDQEHLAQINKNIKILIGELDRLVTFKASFKQLVLDKVIFSENNLDQETKNKIERMYSIYERFDVFITMAPKLSLRLKKLSQMHQKLKDFENNLDNIEKVMNNINQIQSENTCQEFIQHLSSVQLETNLKVAQLDQAIQTLSDKCSKLT